MSAEIIYGVDFRAGKEEAPLCNAPDCQPLVHFRGETFTYAEPTFQKFCFVYCGDGICTCQVKFAPPDGDCA